MLKNIATLSLAALFVLMWLAITFGPIIIIMHFVIKYW